MVQKSFSAIIECLACLSGQPDVMQRVSRRRKLKYLNSSWSFVEDESQATINMIHWGRATGRTGFRGWLDGWLNHLPSSLGFSGDTWWGSGVCCYARQCSRSHPLMRCNKTNSLSRQEWNNKLLWRLLCWRLRSFLVAFFSRARLRYREEQMTLQYRRRWTVRQFVISADLEEERGKLSGQHWALW